MLNWLLIILRIRRLERKKCDSDRSEEDSKKSFLYKSCILPIVDYFPTYLNSLHFNFFQNNDYIYYMHVKNKQLNNNGFYLFNNNINIFSTSQLSYYGLKSI